MEYRSALAIGELLDERAGATAVAVLGCKTVLEQGGALVVQPHQRQAGHVWLRRESI